MTTATLTLNEVLSRLMYVKKLRTTELAKLANVPQPTLHRMVVGSTVNPNQATLQSVANYFDVSINQLKGLEPISWLSKSSHNNEMIKVPLLSWDQVINLYNGSEIFTENQDIFIDASVSQRCFALKVKDSSMEPQFRKETTIIIDLAKEPKDRCFVIAQIENYQDVIFRQLLIDGPHRFLKPTSPDFNQYKMTLMSKNDIIIGVLAQSRFDHAE